MAARPWTASIAAASSSTSTPSTGSTSRGRCGGRPRWDRRSATPRPATWSSSPRTATARPTSASRSARTASSTRPAHAGWSASSRSPRPTGRAGSWRRGAWRSSRPREADPRRRGPTASGRLTARWTAARAAGAELAHDDVLLRVEARLRDAAQAHDLGRVRAMRLLGERIEVDLRIGREVAERRRHHLAVARGEAGEVVAQELVERRIGLRPQVGLHERRDIQIERRPVALAGLPAIVAGQLADAGAGGIDVIELVDDGIELGQPRLAVAVEGGLARRPQPLI